MVPVSLSALLDCIAAIDDGERDSADYQLFGVGYGQVYALAALLFAASATKSVCMHQFWMIGIRCGMHMQSGLMAKVFDAGIKLRGRSSYDDGALVNLMLVDACRIAGEPIRI